MDSFETSIASSPVLTNLVTVLDAGRLPQLAIGTARLHRLAVDQRLSAMLAHSFGITEWSVSTHSMLTPQRAVRLHLRWGMHTASLVIDTAQHAGLPALLESDQDIGSDTARIGLRAAIAAILLSPLLRAFDLLGMPGVELSGIDVETHAAEGMQSEHCAITLRANAQRFDVVVGHIDEAWLHALEQLVAQQLTPLAAQISEIAVPGRLQIGEKIISVATLDSLQVGDVILRALPDSLRRYVLQETTSITLPIAWGHYGARRLEALAEVQNNAFTLTQDPTMSYTSTDASPSQATDVADMPVEINQLDLPLKLEIDTVSLPVAQLSALREGYVLELPTSIPDARIRLVTYGQTIGFGELVSVGDHLGVRLVQLSQNHGSV